MYKPKYFCKTLDQLAKEVLPEHLYKERGAYNLRLMDEKALITLDHLRKYLDVPLTVNSWSWGGNRNASGYRDVVYYGSNEKYVKSTSQHKYGRAIDCVSTKMSAVQMRDFILENKQLFPYITFLEVGVNWLHFDTRFVAKQQYDGDTIVCWSPTEGFLSEEAVLKYHL